MSSPFLSRLADRAIKSLSNPMVSPVLTVLYLNVTVLSLEAAMYHLISKTLGLMLCAMLLGSSAIAATPAPPGAVVYIISPMDGDKVSNPVRVRFGLRGMGVAPAGVDREKTGHHHLLIDVVEMPKMDQPLPSDENHRHFGGGQTEVDLNLSKGSHTLQLMLGDKDHIPFSPPLMSDPITITVE